MIAEGERVTYDMKPTRDDPTAVGTSEYADAIIEQARRLTARRGTHERTDVNGRKKVTVIGAGNVGATCAHEVARRDYADVVLVDIIPNFPQGKALDMNQAASVLGYEPNDLGHERLRRDRRAPTSSSSPPASRARPGMSRDDLVDDERGDRRRRHEGRRPALAQGDRSSSSRTRSTRCATSRKAVSGFPKERVVGMAGILDTARFSAFIAWETGASVKDVQAMVLGGHGDQMVPVVSATTVGGVPLDGAATEGADREDGRAHAQGRRRDRRTCSARPPGTRPGAAAAQMVDAICSTRSASCPCTALLEGEYGIDGLYMGVPVKLGAAGIEEIVKLRLTARRRRCSARRPPPSARSSPS